MSKWIVGPLMVALQFLPAAYANAVPSPLTVGISGLDPNKTNWESAVINHQRVFLPKSEWAVCSVAPTQAGDSLSYTWTVEHPGALDQPATVISTDKRFYLSWMYANPVLGSFLTCHVRLVRDGVTTQAASSVFVSHELPSVRLKINGVPIDSNVQVGNIASCGYTANGDNSVVGFTWSASTRSTGENEQVLDNGRSFTFTKENLALLQNKYLICKAHSGVDPYYLDNLAAVFITDRPAFRPADLGKASVTTAALPTFNMNQFLLNGSVSFAIDSTSINQSPSYLSTTAIHPGQIVSTQILTPIGAGILWMEEKVYDANGRLVNVVPMSSKINNDGSTSWITSWTVPKGTTIYANGYWPIKIVATRATDLQTAPAVTIAGAQIAGIVGTLIPCTYSTGTISTQTITSTSYC